MAEASERVGYITRVQSFSACHRLHRWVSPDPNSVIMQKRLFLCVFLTFFRINPCYKHICCSLWCTLLSLQMNKTSRWWNLVVSNNWKVCLFFTINPQLCAIVIQFRKKNPKKNMCSVSCVFLLKHSPEWWREQEGLWKMQQPQRTRAQLQRWVEAAARYCTRSVFLTPPLLPTAEITVRGKVGPGTTADFKIQWERLIIKVNKGESNLALTDRSCDWDGHEPDRLEEVYWGEILLIKRWNASDVLETKAPDWSFCHFWKIGRLKSSLRRFRWFPEL